MNNHPTRFCIDETSFKLVSEEKDCIIAYIDRFIELVDKLKDDDQNITRWSELEFVEVVPGLTVSDLIYREDISPLERDVRTLLIHIINRCERWDDDFKPVKTCFEIAGIQINATSLNYVFEQIVAGRAMACVCLPRNSQAVGECEVARGNNSTSIYFLTNENQAVGFYRAIIEIENLNEADYIFHTPLAFPDLYFVQDIHKQFRKFNQKYSVVRSQVTRHLSALNDDFRDLCEQHNHNMEMVFRILKSDKGIDVSGESHPTRQNRTAMREREVIIDGETVVCEYHTKLTNTYDRIHFHIGKQGIAEGKVIIGIFADHLTT